MIPITQQCPLNNGVLSVNFGNYNTVTLR